MFGDVGEFELELLKDERNVFLSFLVVSSDLMVRVIEGQTVDPLCQTIRGRILFCESVEDWQMSVDGALRFSGRLFVSLHCKDDVL